MGDSAMKQRTILLRLDDGSLVGPAAKLGIAGDGVVRLPVDQAANIGRASEKEITRLKALLDKIKAQYDLPQPVHQPPQYAPPPKKARPAPVEVHPVLDTDSQDWVAKCQALFQKLLGAWPTDTRNAFYYPADRNTLPQYYIIIKEPVFLQDIEDRLTNRKYQSPEQFVRDIRLHFTNVRKFNNQTGNIYRMHGNQMEKLFDQWWPETGLAERSKRMNAGQAAHKFDPEEAPAKSRPARSQGASKRPARQNGLANTHSANLEATSGRQHIPGAPAPLTAERKAEMASFLSSDALTDELSQQLLGLLPPALMEGVTSGEVELDFDQLDDETLGRIDAWMRTLPGGIGGGPAAVAHVMSPQQPQPSARADSFDDDDDDYEGDESDDSD